MSLQGVIFAVHTLHFFHAPVDLVCAREHKTTGRRRVSAGPEIGPDCLLIMQLRVSLILFIPSRNYERQRGEMKYGSRALIPMH
jgi:hypothetical protein